MGIQLCNIKYKQYSTYSSSPSEVCLAIVLSNHLRRRSQALTDHLQRNHSAVSAPLSLTVISVFSICAIIYL